MPLLVSLALGLVVGAIAYRWGAIEPSWDVLERSDILENWSTTPKTHRSFPSHVLELWLARPLHQLLAAPGRETAGLRALGCLSLGSLGALISWVGGRAGGWALVRSAGTALVFCFAAACLDLGASGEEKMVAGCSLAIAATGVAWLIRNPRARLWHAATIGALCAAAVLVHLTNGVLLVGLAAAAALTLWPAIPQRTAVRRRLVTAGAVAGATLAVAYLWLSWRWYPTADQPVATTWDAITGYHGPQGVVREGTLATGWAAVVGDLPGAAGVMALLSLGPIVLLALDARREPVHWPLVACVAAAVAAWTTNFSSFEPENPESWLGIWCFAGVGWALWFAHARPSRRLDLATSCAAVLFAVAMISLNRGHLGARDNSARAWAEGVENACGDEAMLLATGKEFRAARLYTDLRVIEAGELFGTPVEYTGRSPTPPREVDRHRRRATVCASSTAAAALAPVRPVFERRVAGRVTVLVLGSDLAGS